MTSSLASLHCCRSRAFSSASRFTSPSAISHRWVRALAACFLKN